MKYLLLIILFIAPCIAYGQTSCPDGSVCVKQGILDKCADVADQLKAAKDVIAKFETERGVTAAERTAAQSLIKALNELVDTRGRIIQDQTAMISLQKQVIETYSQLVEKLTAQLNKKQSAFSKLVAIVEKVTFLLAGIAIAGL